MRFDPSATMRVATWLGEDIGRLDGILATLVSTYGTNRRLTATDVEPFLGEAGGVPPWDFTDAVDAGETTKALTLLGRMMGAGERHPLQVMAVLHNHYGRLARLDGIDAGSEADAAEAMGIKPGYPAKKALANYRRLGGGGIQRAIQLLAQADMDLRGERDLPNDLVMEVLVAQAVAPRRHPTPLTGYWPWLTLCIKRLFLRAAALAWIMPLAAAMSMRLTARRTASSLPSVPIVDSAFLMRVFNSLLTALFRSARLALVMMRFFWLLMFATDNPLRWAAD